MVDEVIASIDDIDIIGETEVSGTVMMPSDSGPVATPNRQLHAIRIVAPALRGVSNRNRSRESAGYTSFAIAGRTRTLDNSLSKSTRLTMPTPLDMDIWSLSTFIRWERKR